MKTYKDGIMEGLGNGPGYRKIQATVLATVTTATVVILVMQKKWAVWRAAIHKNRFKS